MSGFDITVEDMDTWFDQAMLQEKGIEGYGSEEAKQAYLDSLGDPLAHPMWADPADCVNHPMMEAFRQIREEDKTNFELAVMYKDEGNEWLKGGLSKKKEEEKKERTKMLHEARGCYAHALVLIKKAEDEGDEDGAIPKVEELTSSSSSSSSDRVGMSDREILKSQTISNKALVALHLRNFGEARKDAKLSIGIWKYNTKGWYRMCKALNAVGRHDECVQACDEAVKTLYTSTDSTDTRDAKGQGELEGLKKDSLTKIVALKRAQEAKLQREREIENRWRYAWRVLQLLQATAGYHHSCLPARLAMDESACYPRLRDTLTQKEVDPFAALDDDHSGFKQPVELEMPVIFLYPQHNQVDIIKAADPHTTFSDHLQVMFPGTPGTRVYWDKGRPVPEYVHDKLVVYVCMNAAPTVSSEDMWVAACEEKRDADGHNGGPPAQRARARMGARDTAHAATADRNAVAASPDKAKTAKAAAAADDASAFLALTKGRNWLRVDSACLFATVLSTPGVVLPGGVQTYIIFPEKAVAHSAFIQKLEKDKVSIGHMKPQ